MTKINSAYKYKTLFEVPYEFFQTWTNRIVTLQTGAVTNRVHTRRVRHMERSLSMRRSRFLTDMRLWLSGIYRMDITLRGRLEDRARVPQWVSISHSRISLIVAQSPSPANAFFGLAESFTSPNKEGKISLRARMVISENLCCWVGSIWAAQRRWSI